VATRTKKRLFNNPTHTSLPGADLYLGDCLAVIPSLAGPFGAVVTDPPYGVDYDPSWRNEAGVSATTRTGRV